MNASFQNSLRLLLRYLRPLAARVALLGLLLSGGIAVQLINPQIIRRFLDTAQAGGQLASLLNAGALFLGLALGGQLLSTAAGYLSEDVGWRATNRLRADLAAHCLRLDLPFHHAHTPGELIERVDGDVGLLAEFFSQLVVQVLGNALLALGILALLFREDPRFGLVGLAYALLLGLFLRGVQGFSVRKLAEARQADAELSGFLEEALVTTEDARPNGAVPYLMTRFHGLMRTQFLTTRRARVLLASIFSGSLTIYGLVKAAGLMVGAALFFQGALTIGTLFLVAYYLDLLETPLNQVRRQVTNLHRALAAMGRIQAFAAEQPQVREAPQTRLLRGPLAVSFEAVSFRYGEHAAALEDISFELPPGQVLGLIGRTGSGKSTLSRLLFRLYDPDQGAISLGGRDLRHLALADLRDRVGMVTQEVQLFAAPVRDNLTFFDRSTPEAHLLDALRELGLEGWLAGLPGGLEAHLQSGGRGLSGGEAQLLAFARVLLKDPGLVILDEASSRLDPATERRLDLAVDRLLEGRTGILIAHRLSTLRRADKILLLAGGRIAEFGDRLDLEADPNSQYARLLQAGLEALEAAPAPPWSAAA